MKKLIAILTVFVLVLSTKVGAQGAGKVTYQDMHFTTRLQEGANTQVLAGGTLQFTKRGDTFSNIVFLDSLGNRNVLTSTRPGTNGAPQPGCKYPLPDACFGTANKNIGLCICKPTDLTYKMEFSYRKISKLGASSTIVIRID